MHRPTWCAVLTILIYAGVAVAVVPLFLGRLTHSVLCLSLGAATALVSGLARACFTEGDCDPRVHTQRIP